MINFSKTAHPITAWLLLAVLGIAALFIMGQIRERHRWNELIENPEKIPGDMAGLPDQVAFARASYLNEQGDFQQSLRIYKSIERSNRSDIRNAAIYNMGSIYLQQAAQLWHQEGIWEHNQINTLLDLAEQSLRQVLIAQPEHWQARYNLAYALRIRPPAKEQEEADWTGNKSSVHAVLPGIPAGGP